MDREVPATSPEELVQLVAAVARGGEAALRELFDATVRHVHAAAFLLTGSHDRADALVAEVYFKVWSGATSYDPARAPVIHWLYHLTRTLAEEAGTGVYYSQNGEGKTS
ncbi:hypothetical protein BWI17_21270 [Betaproteobacteria bacterium GR16-43]|nr:hypothetical protein BWI17_21270 [Betaproteobacteria bacterium GR16-43]